MATRQRKRREESECVQTFGSLFDVTRPMHLRIAESSQSGQRLGSQYRTQPKGGWDRAFEPTQMPATKGLPKPSHAWPKATAA
jgi:hypothetical protein